MGAIYAIGDIHGQLEMLRAAHQRIAADQAREGTQNAPIVHLGDLTDRGPDSKGVLDYLIQGIARGENWVVIKGNHDRMFSRFVRCGDPADSHIKSGKTWLHPRLGGPMTLASYGMDPAQITPEMQDLNLAQEGMQTALNELAKQAREWVPEAHLSFLDTLPLWHQTDQLLFVHAGLRPGQPLAQQAEDDLLWIREGWLDHTGAHPYLVIHGHTALEQAQHHGNRVNLDSGAGYGRPLSAAVFEDGDVWTLTKTSRVALRP